MHMPVQSSPVNRGLVASAPSFGGILPMGYCIGASVNSQGQVCVNTPLGDVCIPISTPLPPGIGVQACIDICTHWWFPTGACVSVMFNGQTIGRQCIGSC